jgi:large subunit ribosomal protein L33
MAKKENREVINMQCTVCKKINYQTTKRKKIKAGEKSIERLVIKKLCRNCKQHTEHKETK